MKSATVINTQSANNPTNREDDDLVLGLPRLKPGQTCSSMDLVGCLAGRVDKPLTIEDMDEAEAEDAVERYMATLE